MNDTLKIKIVYDGAGVTKILTENDEPIGAVQEVTWSVNAKDFLPKCSLVLIANPINISKTLAEIKYIHTIDESNINSLSKKEIYSLYKKECERRTFLEIKYNDYPDSILLESNE